MNGLKSVFNFSRIALSSLALAMSSAFSLSISEWKRCTSSGMAEASAGQEKLNWMMSVVTSVEKGLAAGRGASTGEGFRAA